jgi:hypothetical protein
MKNQQSFRREKVKPTIGIKERTNLKVFALIHTHVVPKEQSTTGETGTPEVTQALGVTNAEAEAISPTNATLG